MSIDQQTFAFNPISDFYDDETERRHSQPAQPFNFTDEEIAAAEAAMAVKPLRHFHHCETPRCRGTVSCEGWCQERHECRRCSENGHLDFD